MEKIKKGFKRWLVIHIEYYMEKKKIGKENRQETNAGISLKKTDKN